MRPALGVRLHICDAVIQAGDGWYHPMAELFMEVRPTGSVELVEDRYADVRLKFDGQSGESAKRFELIAKFSCFHCGAPVGRSAESGKLLRWACDAHAKDPQAAIPWRVACRSSDVMSAVRDWDARSVHRAFGQHVIWTHWFALSSYLDPEAARTIARLPYALIRAMDYLDEVMEDAPEIAQIKAQLESAEALFAVEDGLRKASSRT